MQVVIRKWGNSAGIRIPASILEMLKLKADHLVEMNVEQGRIVIEPVKQEFCLEQLLSNITPENLHQEIDTGEPIGKEQL